MLESVSPFKPSIRQASRNVSSQAAAIASAYAVANPRYSVSQVSSAQAPKTLESFSPFTLKMPLAYRSALVAPFIHPTFKHGTPLSLQEVRQYVTDVWQRLGLESVKPPSVVVFKHGNAPAYVLDRTISAAQWPLMGVSFTHPPAGIEYIRQPEGGPVVQVRLHHLLMVPDKTMKNGELGVLAHEVAKSTRYPGVIAATMAGQISLPLTMFDTRAIDSVRQLGLHQSKSVVNDGRLRHQLSESAKQSGQAMVAAIEQLNQLEDRQLTDTPLYEQTQHHYRRSFTAYFTNPEVVTGLMIYAGVRGDQARWQCMSRLYGALQKGDQRQVQQALTTLSTIGLPESDPPLKRIAAPAAISFLGRRPLV